ncbi:hypothetical protein ACP70R_040286 [Stipagrostis hirtigluma subsp. patula]
MIWRYRRDGKPCSSEYARNPIVQTGLEEEEDTVCWEPGRNLYVEEQEETVSWEPGRNLYAT